LTGPFSGTGRPVDEHRGASFVFSVQRATEFTSNVALATSRGRRGDQGRVEQAPEPEVAAAGGDDEPEPPAEDRLRVVGCDVGGRESS